MTIDARLNQLRRRLDRKAQLVSQLSDLYVQRLELSGKVRQYEMKKIKEQEDVERLEGRSLAAFFYNVLGKMDEQLTKERREAYEAAVKYDAAKSEYDYVCRQIERFEAESSSLENALEEYDTAKKAKAAAIKESGNSVGDELVYLEEKIDTHDKELREIDEASASGIACMKLGNQILACLEEAEGLGLWDAFGGGLIATAAKHSKLDEAQALVEQLQLQLRDFKTELYDVHVTAEIEVYMGEFLTFADYFFDGLFADLSVLERIENAMNQVNDTRDQVAEVLDGLAKLRVENKAIKNEAVRKYEELLMTTSI